MELIVRLLWSPRCRATALLICAAAANAQTVSEPNAQPPPRELIDGIKDFENRNGFPKTGSFEKSSESAASYRCYYSEPLELPESYDDLKLRQETGNACSVDGRKFDVFFYALQAAGSNKTTVTPALAHSSTERILVVVPHEDYHIRSTLPTSLSEAVATLVGFATAADYARNRFGPESAVFRNLAMEADLFLRKSLIVNRHYTELREVYDQFHGHRITKRKALTEKIRIFDQLRVECRAITPDPTSFDKNVSAYNNAGLAFDRTYTEFYPLIYELFQSRNRDLKLTIDTLNRELKQQGLSKQQASDKIRRATLERREK